MDPAQIARLALELCDLLQLQLDSLMGRKFSDFTPEELAAYQKRKSRIAELRAELRRIARQPDGGYSAMDSRFARSRPEEVGRPPDRAALFSHSLNS